METISSSDLSTFFHSNPILLTGFDLSLKKQEIKDYYNKTYTQYEKLFEILAYDQAFYLRSEPLRHPLIFYYGHTATFYINKFIISGLIKNRVNPEFESMCAVGVDEMSWDDLLPEHYNWPKVDELKVYRSHVREVVSRLIQETPITLPITWDSPFWVIIMAIEHERIHLETSSVIIRRLEMSFVKNSPYFIRCPISHHSGYEGERPKIEKLPINSLLPLQNYLVELQKDEKFYGWDNEFGVFKKQVPEFKASKYLVSNGEYLEFMNQGGYQKEEFWNEEGKSWLKSTKTHHPVFWVSDPENPTIYKFRSLSEVMEMPWDWPVETNYLEAKAFCNWKAKQTKKLIRLPTEAEYYSLRSLIKEDVCDDGFEKKGNIGLYHWASSCPINMFETQGFCDIIGNVWQHSESEINGFLGFKVHKFYDDFSTPTFDGKHNLIKGGSWISTGNEAMKNARYAFRRHFFQHAGFRYVEAEELEESQSFFYKIDEVEGEMLEFNYGEEHFNVKNFGNNSAEICKKVFKENNYKSNNRRALDVGCNMGRTSFELSKEFEEVIGIDFSARFFHLVVGLNQNGVLNYMVRSEGQLNDYKTVELENFEFYPYKERVTFYQQPDVSNIDILKFKDFDLIFAGNIIENLSNPRDFLSRIDKYLVKNGILVLASTYDWKIELTPLNNWLGGFKQDGENKQSYEGIKDILEEKFEEISEPINEEFVVKESKNKYQHNISQFSFWRKK